MNDILLSFTLIFGIGLFFQWLAWYLKLPSVIFLLAAGIILGPVFGLIHPSEIFGELFEPFIELAVIIIVFDGALSLKMKELPSIYKGLVPLLAIGPLLSFVLTTIFSYGVLNLNLPFSLLIGSILVVTGPTVVIPLLRSSNTHKRVSNIIKWEGIINDPFAVLITAFVYQMILVWGKSSAFSLLVVSIVKSLAVGYILGVFPVYGFISFSKRRVIPKYLNNAIIFVTVVISSTLAESFQQGSAVLVATIQGFILGNSSMDLLEELKSFKESITILLLSTVFITLAAELNSSHVTFEVLLMGIGLFLGLLIIRMIVVFLTTSGSGCSWQEKFLVGWCAPRGIVAASMAGLFAHKLEKEGFVGGDIFEALIFFIIISTVLIYGGSFKWLAKRLGLTNKEAHGLLIVGATPWTIDLAEHLKQLEVPVAISDSMWHGLKQARLNGVKTFYGDLVKLIDNDDIELSQYHAILAATSNTSYNSLVCTRLSSEFGWESVYQLPPDTSDDGNPIKELPIGMRGRIIKDPRATFFNLYDLSYKGWKFRKTSITPEFNLEKLLEETPNAFHLLHVSKAKKLHFINSIQRHSVQAGDHVLSLVPPNSESDEFVIEEDSMTV